MSKHAAHKQENWLAKAVAVGAKAAKNGDEVMEIRTVDFERLVEAYETKLDEEALARALVDREEAFPIELFDRIDAGESAVRAFRTYRNMNQEALAEAAGINRAMISMIESGRKNGSLQTYKAIADALDVTIDDLVG